MTNIIKIIRYRISWSKNITKKFNSKWRVSWVVSKIHRVTLEETDIPEKSVTQSRSGSTLRRFCPIQFPYSTRYCPGKIQWNRPRHYKGVPQEFQKAGLRITGYFWKNSPITRRPSVIIPFFRIFEEFRYLLEFYVIQALR